MKKKKKKKKPIPDLRAERGQEENYTTHYIFKDLFLFLFMCICVCACGWIGAYKGQMRHQTPWSCSYRDL